MKNYNISSNIPLKDIVTNIRFMLDSEAIDYHFNDSIKEFEEVLKNVDLLNEVRSVNEVRNVMRELKELLNDFRGVINEKDLLKKQKLTADALEKLEKFYRDAGGTEEI